MCYNEYIKGKETLQTRKAKIMKKSTVEMMIAYLNGETVDNAALMAELTEEMNKYEDSAKRRADVAAKKAVAINEQVIPVVLDILLHTQEGMTVKEIFAAGEGRWPEDYSAAKLQSVFTRGALNGKVVTHENGRKARSYSLNTDAE